MITHQQCKGVADVEAFLKAAKLSLSQVKIVSVAGKFGSTYMLFYDSDDANFDGK